MTPRIFISYRREDAAGDAGRLADHLYRRFGAANVFLDIDTINPGSDFVEALHASLQQTAAALVVIGPRWTSLRAADGTRRLDNPKDFVRLEVEAALGRGIPVVPVLVQGAAMPQRQDVPESLAPLLTRQIAAIDHAEFHPDAERLCDRLEALIGMGASGGWSLVRRWWPAALMAALILAVGGYVANRATEGDPAAPTTAAGNVPASGAAMAGRGFDATALVSEAAAQRRRGQSVEALATLARARESAPDSDVVRQAQEDTAMEWIRNVRVEGGKSSFGEAIKPALAVVDASLPAATGSRRADLLAHSGWAAYLMWRDGNRRLDPAEWYRQALEADPGNPYANAMLAHWTLEQGDDVAGAAKLFDTALRAGRASEAVRTLQWGAYGNARTRAADTERVRLADAMRRNGERLSMGQAQALWSPYYLLMPAAREKERLGILEAVPPDDHIKTLAWAFEAYAANDESRRRTIRFYVALLHARAGRTGDAAAELRTLDKELVRDAGSLREAVKAALRGLEAVR